MHISLFTATNQHSALLIFLTFFFNSVQNELFPSWPLAISICMLEKISLLQALWSSQIFIYKLAHKLRSHWRNYFITEMCLFCTQRKGCVIVAWNSQQFKNLLGKLRWRHNKIEVSTLQMNVPSSWRLDVTENEEGKRHKRVPWEIHLIYKDSDDNQLDK